MKSFRVKGAFVESFRSVRATSAWWAMGKWNISNSLRYQQVAASGFSNLTDTIALTSESRE